MTHETPSATLRRGDAADDASDSLREALLRASEILMAALVAQARGLQRYGAPVGAHALARQALTDLPGLYVQSQRFLYRLLFVLFAESRGLLPVDQPHYSASYSLQRLRQSLERRPPAGSPRTYRLWRRLQALFALLCQGSATAQLHLAPCCPSLFDPAATPYLQTLHVPDAALREIVHALVCKQGAAGCEPIDYRHLGVETLGALYESLLEFEPRIATEPMHEIRQREGRAIVVPARSNCDPVTGAVRSPILREISAGSLYLARGAGRKVSGSYYTPPPLVRYLVAATLGPLVSRCQSAEEILDISVVDPALGCGAFLIGACHYLAEEYARRLHGLAPAPAPLPLSEAQLRPYRRLVAERCLYGVDLNATAVELARISLWLITQADPQSLAEADSQDQNSQDAFLLTNLRCGNSLIGSSPCSALSPDGAPARGASPAPGRGLPRRPWLNADSDPVEAERLRLQERQRCDRYVAACLWEAEPLREVTAEAGDPTEAARAALLREVRPFHWDLEFPQIFYHPDGTPRANPGFAAVLSNPPWDILKPNAREFFAAYDPAFRELERVAAEVRQQMLLADASIHAAWRAQARALEQLNRYVRLSGDYPAHSVSINGRQTAGDLNTYRLFLERAWTLLRQGGLCGMIVPSSLYTDQGSTGLRQLLLTRARIVSLLSFENRRLIFPIDSRVRFALLVFAREAPAASFRAAFMLHDPAVLAAPERVSLSLPVALIRRFAPDTLSLMELRSQRDADLIARIYAEHPLLGERLAGDWSVAFTREFDMTNDRSLFNQERRGWPLYEGKTIHQYTHCFAPPRYHVMPEVGRPVLLRKAIARLETMLDAVARERFPALSSRRERVAALLAAHGRNPLAAADVCLDCDAPRLVFRRVASSTNERSLIAALLPPRVFVGNTLTYIVPWRLASRLPLEAPCLRVAYQRALPATVMAYLCGVLNSLMLDYVVRQKITTDITMTQAGQLPVPRLAEDDPLCLAIARRVARLICVGPAFAELRQELLGTTDEVEAGVIPFEEQTRRRVLQQEIDALVARLYGLSAADLEHILSAPYTFPLVAPEIKDGVRRAFAHVGWGGGRERDPA
jgi:hypothetical protein